MLTPIRVPRRAVFLFLGVAAPAMAEPASEKIRLLHDVLDHEPEVFRVEGRP